MLALQLGTDGGASSQVSACYLYRLLSGDPSALDRCGETVVPGRLRLPLRLGEPRCQGLVSSSQLVVSLLNSLVGLSD